MSCGSGLFEEPCFVFSSILPLWFLSFFFPFYFIVHLSLFNSAVGIERDAVNIFTKFVSPDASRPIPITEQIRNDIVGKKALSSA